MTIKTKISALLAVGGLVILILGGQRILGNRSKVQQIERLGDAAVLSVKIGNLVHELQKERGMTAGYLSSKGQKFAKELPLQRETTSQREAEYRSFLESFNVTAHDETLRTALSEVNKSLGQLHAKRDASQAQCRYRSRSSWRAWTRFCRSCR